MRESTAVFMALMGILFVLAMFCVSITSLVQWAPFLKDKKDECPELHKIAIVVYTAAFGSGVLRHLLNLIGVPEILGHVVILGLYAYAVYLLQGVTCSIEEINQNEKIKDQLTVAVPMLYIVLALSSLGLIAVVYMMMRGIKVTNKQVNLDDPQLEALVKNVEKMIFMETMKQHGVRPRPRPRPPARRR